MRTSDIKVGEEYAYQPNKWSAAKRVKVLEVGVERQEGSHYRYTGTRRVKNGVRVEGLNHKGRWESVVASREISEPWLEYQTRNDEIAASKEAAERFRRARAEEIIRDMRRIDDTLQAAGVEAVKRQLWLTKDDDLLRKYYSVQEEDIRLFTITTAIPRPDKVISKGVIDLSVVLTLMDRLNL